MNATRANDAQDERFMLLALGLARRGLGRVWPNPSVGCVIVDADGRIVARGWTEDGGRPHAETQALGRAGACARGATAYVSLEPCAHHGKTGPCAEALIAAGVSRVVTATEDPDPRVAGKGHAVLRAAGIELRLGVCAAEAQALNAGFISRIRSGRPWLTLKLATTLDGKVALPSGESRWITGERSRAHGHLQRARHDAVLVGIGTAVADDPQLTCRLPGMDTRRLVRIVVDSQARLSPSSKLAETANEQPVWLLTSSAADKKSLAALAAKGIRVLIVPGAPNRVDLAAAMKSLGDEGLTRVLVEGGATLATALVEANLVDRLLWYRAPTVMGEGLSAVGALPVAGLGEMPRFEREGATSLGDDALETYRRAP